ncbi:SprT family zinc-dependent metalloprotease [uncultured Pseudoteredinibacter sp.]|uniref:M48 family metallopeptidase n=1 Tax=uncultured Pseudoteredinibacter sp. TaxID=1641701 RepID=UPI00262F51C7|nr:SprT family zinc-dependent metalloprotease [uncultured Pseudoteredinibacter sp.]
MIESKASQQELPGIQLVRSKRKSLAITIEAGQVIVRAPLRLPKSEIQAFILKKEAWILRTVKAQSEQLAEVPQRQYIDGEYLPWRGRSLCLRLKPGKRITERIGDELYTAIAEKSQLEERVQAWYRKEAKLVLTQKVERLAAAHGLKFAEVKVRKSKRRWGHCTSKAVLQFNWLIMLAPESVINYLVAHEVAHLRHFNHGPEFWRLVQCFEPGYQQAQAWLKENGHLLVL